MCEPVSCLIAGGICCCCIVMMAVAGAWMGQKLMNLAAVGMEALNCANETVTEQLTTMQKSDPTFKERCLDMGEKCVSSQEHELTPEEKADCKKQMSKCECDIATHMTSMEAPTFEESLTPCCDTFQNAEKIEHDMAEGAAKICKEMLTEISSNFTQMSTCCAGATPEKCSLSSQDENEFMQPVTSGVTEFFEKVNKHHELQVKHRASIDATHAALFGSVALFGAFAMVALLRRRKSRNPTVLTRAPERHLIGENELATTWAVE